jgi:c-di-GMP-binding flagellar brake protein YcgR
MQGNSPGFERRRHARFALRVHSGISRVEITPTQVLVGRAIDVSDGGIRMVLEGKVQPGQVLKCELAVPELPVRIPTLTQARWCSELSREHVCGLRFLI